VIGKGKRRPKSTDLPSVIADVADGMSLRKACEKAGLNVSHTHTAIDADPELREHYARAREHRSDALAEQALTLGLAAAAGRMEPNGVRVAIDAIKWVAGRMNPKADATNLNLNMTVSTGVPRADG